MFLANGSEIWLWDFGGEAHPHQVKIFSSQADLERRVAARATRGDPLSVEIDRRIVERDYQHDCIDALFKEIAAGRRKMLVEMATRTGKTRTAAALTLQGWLAWLGIDGWFASESPAGFDRNAWLLCLGTRTIGPFAASG